MKFIDSHTHLYLPDFADDFSLVIENAISKGIVKMILPNIDSESYSPMMNLCNLYPANCYPAIGLHPTSVNELYKRQLDFISSKLSENKFVAIGEIGIDLYWDKSFAKKQEEAFSIQVDIAKSYDLPIIIHCRESFGEIIKILGRKQYPAFKGVFHSFSGNIEQAKIIIEMGFKIGINGIITYKNSNLPETVIDIALDNIILETDSPYLTPIPHRGKRNESSYIIYIAEKIAKVKNVSIAKVAEVTTSNAHKLFGI